MAVLLNPAFRVGKKWNIFDLTSVIFTETKDEIERFAADVDVEYVAKHPDVIRSYNVSDSFMPHVIKL